MGESKRKPPRRKGMRASLASSRELVFYDDAPVQRKFAQRFAPEIDAFIVAIHEAHVEVEAAGKSWPRVERPQKLLLFLHVALNSLYCSVHFLVSGYIQAAGQQARNYGEACAMAMLLLIDAEWESFASQRERFPAHEAMARVTRKRNATLLSKALGLDLVRWGDFRTINRYYDHHSHAGEFSLALHLNLRTGHTILGGEFDAAKQPEYRDHLARAGGGARSLAALVRQIGLHVATIA
jgi:hypothetical protein